METKKRKSTAPFYAAAVVWLAASRLLGGQDNDTRKNLMSVPGSKPALAMAKMALLFLLAVAFMAAGGLVILVIVLAAGWEPVGFWRLFFVGVGQGIMMWAGALPCILLVVLGCILSFPWRMKKRIHPLSQAIEAYGQGKAAEISQEDIPSEFDETVVSFRRLLDQLDQAWREKERVYQEKQTSIADLSPDLRTTPPVSTRLTQTLEARK